MSGDAHVMPAALLFPSLEPGVSHEAGRMTLWPALDAATPLSAS